MSAHLQVGKPKLNVLVINGKGADSAASDKPTEQQGSTTLLSAACGTVDKQWSTLNAYSSAEFKSYTTFKAIGGTGTGLQGLYATHCYPTTEGDPITLNFGVVPNLPLTVTLYFADTYVRNAGERVFDIFADDVAKVRNAGPLDVLWQHLMLLL